MVKIQSHFFGINRGDNPDRWQIDFAEDQGLMQKPDLAITCDLEDLKQLHGALETILADA